MKSLQNAGHLIGDVSLSRKDMIRRKNKQRSHRVQKYKKDQSRRLFDGGETHNVGMNSI